MPLPSKPASNTFGGSAKHMALYQRSGYAARFLTAIMSAPVRADGAAQGRWSRYSALPEGQTEEVLGACRDLTDALYEGLDLRDEIEAVRAQRLGETVLLWGNGS